ncbi:hypothetical protein J18TS1_43600 [Oceanobacillus oncorhynchi subsp. incaldanensis]|uniref:DUF2207 domain-containing protein n=1 Tax=Oceanobacillus oncorhynchi TaxID=545501 RepID=UPI001B299883|nr:DUF2207 domain-containing protein [Oceanobacillus oncorhynchi]GIO21260.1 hypothetical protein J18TS1_43600 [Oceanobacillus oncorhynchi subsp. incaldanensis]
MNKWMKIVAALTMATSMNMVLTLTAFAENEMSDLHIEVELQEDGSGVVTEHRQMNMDEGTELFINMVNLDESEILDFSVEGFTKEPDWDSDDSREEKAGKYGTVSTDDGVELVWGIGEYGENTYTVTYTLSDLVRNLEDGQAMLWNFDTFSDIPAQNLTVEISGFQPFTQENVNFWGFGFDGDIQLEGDRIVWESNGEADGDVIVLTQFPADFFQAERTVDMTLSEQQEEAMDGSTYNSSDNSTLIVIIVSAAVGFSLLIGIGTFFFVRKTNQVKKEAGAMKPIHKRIAENKGKTYAAVPFDGEDYAGLSALLTQMNLGYFEDIFQAYLLKWSVNENISMEAEEESKVFGKKYRTTLTINDMENERNKHPLTFSELTNQIEDESYEGTYEMALWTMLLDAADRNGVVTDNAIQKWGKEHAKEVSTVADYLKDYSEAYLEQQGLFSFEEIKVFGFLQSITVSSKEGEQLADRLIQFDNYLKESDINQFSNASKPLSLKDMMLWSALLGKSDKVSKKLENLVPEDRYEEDQVYLQFWYGTYYTRASWTTGLASGGFHSSTSAATAAGGSGGATGVGGGAGAGGGGGGGAR